MEKSTQIALIVFMAIMSLGVLMQAVVFIAAFVAARETRKKLHALFDDLRINVLPAVSTSRNLLEDISPKIKVITSNLVETTDRIQAMAESAYGVVDDVSRRTKAQAAHVDGMVQGTLDQITHASQTLQHGVSIPFRHLNALVNGLRAGLNVLWQKTPVDRNEVETDHIPV